MSKSQNLLKYTNIAILTVVILVAAFVIYNKAEKESIRPAMAITKAAPDYSLRDSIVNFGMKFLGTPYVAAGCGKDGFDCSGFVYFVFQHYQIEVPRSSSGFEHFGKEILVEDVQKGDILLFLSPTRNVIGHIGIVSNPKGKESDFIHASSGGEMKVMISSLSGKGYTQRFVKAIRVL
jgi:cell wall-associated NlpC family hydrolase